MKITLLSLSLAFGALGVAHADPLALEKLGATVDAPPGSRVQALSSGTTMVMGANDGFTANIQPTKALKPTLAAELPATKGRSRGFKAFTKKETLTDGYVIEYDEMIGGTPAFSVVVRKQLGAVALSCDGKERTAEKREALSKVCRSLTK